MIYAREDMRYAETDGGHSGAYLIIPFNEARKEWEGNSECYIFASDSAKRGK